MDTALKFALAATALVTIAVGNQSHAQQAESMREANDMIDRYSQKTLLKNWALSVCLATIAKDISARNDANATASAYLEFGRQPIEAYDALRKLAEQYANRKYGGSLNSEFNTAKCIDLFHSKELDRLTSSLAKKK